MEYHPLSFVGCYPAVDISLQLATASPNALFSLPFVTSILTQQPATVRTQLANGLTVIAIENPVADIISARFFVRAGHIYETAENSGIFDLLTAVLTKGTRDKNALEIAEIVESIGAGFGADVSSDYSSVSLKTVSARF